MKRYFDAIKRLCLCANSGLIQRYRASAQPKNQEHALSPKSLNTSFSARASSYGPISLVLAFALVASLAIHPAFALGDMSREKMRDGAIALKRGDSGQAVVEYTAALSDASLPNDRRAAILNDRAVAYVRLGKHREAITDYNRAIELFPEYAALYNNRGNLLLALNQTDEAIKDFNHAIALAPGYAAAYNNRAGAALKKGDRGTAIKDYTSALRLIPSNPAPLSGRGRAHLELGRPHAAIRDFSRAVGADARFASGYRNRAEAKLEVGHYDEAIEDLSRAVAFDVSNPVLYLLRGHAYLETARHEAGIIDFNRVIELSPYNSAGYEGRGLAQAFLNLLEPAFADLNRAIEINPRSSNAFAYRSFAYVRNQQPDIGLKDVATAAKLDQKNPDVFWARAEALDAQGQTESAIENLSEALALKPGFKRAVDTLARLGVADPNASDQVVAQSEVAGWQIVQNTGRYYAVHRQFKRIRVPLEMMGKGKPKLLSWELKDKPFRSIGLLRFFAGRVPGPNGKNVVEQVALIDLRESKIVAIEPHRLGKKTSQWTWHDNGQVTVASVDGITDEFALRTVAQRPLTTARHQRRSNPSATWSPWGQNPWGAPQPSYKKKRRAGRRKKKKSFFKLLFGN